MNVIEYQHHLKPGCLSVFKSNLGKFFHDDELQEFDEYLDSVVGREAYFVVLNNDDVIGCGGYAKEGDAAVLCWGMVHRRFHGQAIGALLLDYRLAHLAREHGACTVRLDTSQHTSGFYEKYGFGVVDTLKNGFGPGIDKVSMRLRVGEVIASD